MISVPASLLPFQERISFPPRLPQSRGKSVYSIIFSGELLALCIQHIREVKCFLKREVLLRWVFGIVALKRYATQNRFLSSLRDLVPSLLVLIRQ
jgi:hypothetical protein